MMKQYTIELSEAELKCVLDAFEYQIRKYCEYKGDPLVVLMIKEQVEYIDRVRSRLATIRK